jgi:hypothetical protein
MKAHENIVKNWEAWRKASEISWKQYLCEIQKNSLTGEWAKEVAKHLTNNEGTKNVRES